MPSVSFLLHFFYFIPFGIYIISIFISLTVCFLFCFLSQAILKFNQFLPVYWPYTVCTIQSVFPGTLDITFSFDSWWQQVGWEIPRETETETLFLHLSLCSQPPFGHRRLTSRPTCVTNQGFNQLSKANWAGDWLANLAPSVLPWSGLKLISKPLGAPFVWTVCFSGPTEVASAMAWACLSGLFAK